jgi:hypothetical protein
MASESYQVSTIPHFRGVLIPVAQHAELRDRVQILSETVSGEPILLLSPYAGFYYLAAGIKNPTPFDYPAITTLTREGEDEVVAAIAGREIRMVCLDSREPSPLRESLRPERLERYVQVQMERGPDLGSCTIYSPRWQGGVASGAGEG